MEKITLRFLLSISMLCFPLFGKAQEKSSISQDDKCLTDSYNAELLKSNPNMMGSEAFERILASKIAELKSQNTEGQRGTIITIPVVVHVLHNGEALGTGPNISDAQVQSQITVMNQDYRKMFGTPGYNTNPVGADIEIEFELAKRTPDGCPTNGINRVNICQDGTNQSDVQYWKTQTYWDPSKYMNMWSSKYVGDLNGILGYAQFPGGSANTDGVSASYEFFGSSDYGSFPLSAPYDKGRTMTHEVGHYLGLYHTFQGGCTGVGDEVADTPAVSSPNYGCPAGTDSCPSATGVDMIENYMDYTDDTCMNIFTNGQKTRITSVLSTYVNRNTLATSDGATPLADVGNDAAVKFNCYDVSGCVASTQPTIIITNWGTATLTAATISYDFDGNNAQTYSWSGSLAYGAYAEVTLPAISVSGTVLNINITNANGSADQRSCNNSISKTFSPAPTYSTAQVHLELLTDNYCEETSWEFIDGSGTVIYSGGPYTQNTQDNTTFNYDFDVNTNECYSFVIYDEYGDGICCDYGTGSYELTTDDATVIFSGGNFGSSETTNLTVQTLSTDDFSLANSIFLYPNPTSSILNIKTKGELPDGFIIYNMLGQKVASRTIISQADLVIKTENLSNGMYFVKITQGGSQVSLPFVKQ